MEFTKKELVDLVIDFYETPGRYYDLAVEEELTKKFASSGFAEKDEERIRLTTCGEAYLHEFIKKETDDIIEKIKQKGREVYLYCIIKDFDYGEDTSEFLTYVLKNEADKENARLAVANVIVKDIGETMRITIL
ncbi:hypothetical protein [Parablautia sp. Marseille-Q6255]|uniref:hypothetical protein n=1 Tax=Parablautia sp. Marseille-Q6255 TaxID=3039593 RepID=UPI0024BC2DC4|nr:hypothetical protein [Parablautia sp. Marseille-Q6255]